MFDRLFGILKKLFDSDSKARVGPLETFAELESKLRETFAKAQEHFELGFDFANWDFEEWFTTSQFDTDDAFGRQEAGGQQLQWVLVRPRI